MFDSELLPIPQFAFPLARMGSLPVGVGEDEGCFFVLEPTQPLLFKGEGHSGRFHFRGATSVLTLDGWPEPQGVADHRKPAPTRPNSGHLRDYPVIRGSTRALSVVSISMQFRADFRDSPRLERRGAQDRV